MTGIDEILEILATFGMPENVAREKMRESMKKLVKSNEKQKSELKKLGIKVEK